MTTAAYIRVSSKAQNLATQRDAIERAHSDVKVWYREKQSAKTTQRPELQRLLADARAGRFTKLVVFRLDRLCRSGVADTYAVITELRRAGVTLVSLAESLTIKPTEDDVTSSVLVFAFALAAQLERTAINDRIAAARTRLEAKGEPWGRPPTMSASQVETARRLKGEGRTIRQIAAALGVSRSTVADTLKRPAA